MDVQRNGRTIKSLVHPARNGYLWLLERRADAIGFVDAKPYVKQTVFTKHRPEDRPPEYDETKKPVTGKKVPSVRRSGAARTGRRRRTIRRPDTSTSRQREPLRLTPGVRRKPYEPGKLWLGTEIKDIGLDVTDGTEHIGEIQAWDMNTGQKVWSARSSLTTGDRC